MRFRSQQIKGCGRGHALGFPTINLSIPEDLKLSEGVYAAWVTIDDLQYEAALHYGPIATFGEGKSLEVHLLDVSDDTVPDTEGKMIGIEIVSRLRDVRKFETADDLSHAIAQDVIDARNALR